MSVNINKETLDATTHIIMSIKPRSLFTRTATDSLEQSAQYSTRWNETGCDNWNVPSHRALPCHREWICAKRRCLPTSRFAVPLFFYRFFGGVYKKILPTDNNSLHCSTPNSGRGPRKYTHIRAWSTQNRSEFTEAYFPRFYFLSWKYQATPPSTYLKCCIAALWTGRLKTPCCRLAHFSDNMRSIKSSQFQLADHFFTTVSTRHDHHHPLNKVPFKVSPYFNILSRKEGGVVSFTQQNKSTAQNTLE